MNKGFTLIETLVALTLLMLAVLFSARVMSYALQQSRQSGLRFRLMETSDYYKHYLSSRPFPALELAEGAHRQDGREFLVSWQVEAVAAGLKRIKLLAAAAHASVRTVFYKSNFIQEVKND
ncbi:MAG: type II secretion system protein [Candidatus Aminicenantes bacterium]|nr:type II secretion system protein [Candidatus Aminicenantes bacterium]